MKKIVSLVRDLGHVPLKENAVLSVNRYQENKACFESQEDPVVVEQDSTFVSGELLFSLVKNLDDLRRLLGRIQAWDDENQGRPCPVFMNKNVRKTVDLLIESCSNVYQLIELRNIFQDLVDLEFLQLNACQKRTLFFPLDVSEYLKGRLLALEWQSPGHISYELEGLCQAPVSLRNENVYPYLCFLKKICLDRWGCRDAELLFCNVAVFIDTFDLLRGLPFKANNPILEIVHSLFQDLNPNPKDSLFLSSFIEGLPALKITTHTLDLCLAFIRRSTSFDGFEASSNLFFLLKSRELVLEQNSFYSYFSRFESKSIYFFLWKNQNVSSKTKLPQGGFPSSKEIRNKVYREGNYAYNLGAIFDQRYNRMKGVFYDTVSFFQSSYRLVQMTRCFMSCFRDIGASLFPIPITAKGLSFYQARETGVDRNQLKRYLELAFKVFDEFGLSFDKAIQIDMNMSQFKTTENLNNKFLFVFSCILNTYLNMSSSQEGLQCLSKWCSSNLLSDYRKNAVFQHSRFSLYAMGPWTQTMDKVDDMLPVLRSFFAYAHANSHELKLFGSHWYTRLFPSVFFQNPSDSDFKVVTRNCFQVHDLVLQLIPLLERAISINAIETFDCMVFTSNRGEFFGSFKCDSQDLSFRQSLATHLTSFYPHSVTIQLGGFCDIIITCREGEQGTNIFETYYRKLDEAAISFLFDGWPIQDENVRYPMTNVRSAIELEIQELDGQSSDGLNLLTPSENHSFLPSFNQFLEFLLQEDSLETPSGPYIHNFQLNNNRFFQRLTKMFLKIKDEKVRAEFRAEMRDCLDLAYVNDAIQVVQTDIGILDQKIKNVELLKCVEKESGALLVFEDLFWALNRKKGMKTRLLKDMQTVKDELFG